MTFGKSHSRVCFQRLGEFHPDPISLWRLERWRRQSLKLWSLKQELRHVISDYVSENGSACTAPEPRPYGSCAPGAAAPHRQSGRQRASSRSGAIVCRGGSVMGAPARVAIRSNKQQTPLKKDAGHNARRSMADARVGSYFQRGTGRNVILATWEDQASSL